MALPCKCKKPNVKITEKTIIPICKTCGRAVCQKIEDYNDSKR